MGKTGWNRRLLLAGGTALGLGAAYAALRRPVASVPRRVAVPKGLFRRGNGAEPGSLDPAMITSEPEQQVVGDLITGLMAYDPLANPVPGMAESWTTAPDGLTWTFHLRPALWSDGQPVTAADFIYAWRRILTPATGAPYAYFLYPIRNAEKIGGGKLPPTALGVTAPDPHTLVVQLEHPVPYLLNMLTHSAMYPVPRHVVEAKGKLWTKPENHVGNGAFSLRQWVAHDHILLEKNPRFYDAANVKLERVILYPTDDYSAALQRFRAIELDVQSRIAPDQVDWINAHMPETRDPLSQLSLEMIAINHKRKPFDDIRVRRALNLAVNREVIARQIRRVGDKPAYNIVPPGIANFPGGNVMDFQAWHQDRRVAQAQALMRAAGFGPDNRVRTTYMIRSTAPGNRRAVAAAVQQMYSQIYVDVSILPCDFPIFLGRQDTHDFDISQPAWGADFDDAETFLSLFITGGGNNWGSYSNLAFDALLARSQQETDLGKRGVMLMEAERLLLQDDAVIPLFHWANPEMQRPYVKGWRANKMLMNPSRWVTIDEAARAATVVS